jgi:hypothetical protein
MCNGPYTGSWRFTDLVKIIGITSSYSAHAYLAIRLFLKNLEAIAFTSTVTFGKWETDQHSANSLPQMDA